MGTDIHLYTEKRFNGIWSAIEGENPSIRHNLRMAEYARANGNEDKALGYEKIAADIASGAAQNKEGYGYPFGDDWLSPKTLENWLYDGRNYDLFAILANVRNGHGFAGIETSTGFNSISSNRGLPEDASIQTEILEECAYHSIGYVTLAELLAYDWDQTVIKHGVVNLEGYKDYLINGSPDSYSGGVSGPSVVHITNEEMDDIITGEYPVEEGKSYYTRVSWERTYKECVGSFYDDAIPKLKKLSDEKDYSDIRIVFGFDS